ncbi:7836_t:CDS:2, partial [Racocetra persica]
VRDELPIINRKYKATNSLPIPGNHNCANFVNKSIFDTSQSKYFKAFLPNYNATSYTGYTLTINITDTKYNISNQNDYMEMYAYDKEYDSKPINYDQIQFEESLLLKNMYFFGQPRNDIAILSLMGIAGGAGLISPWGFVQKSKLFRNRYEKNILPLADESDTTEDFNSPIQKRLNNLEKRIQFYENYIIDNSLLNSIKKEDQSTISNSNR